jgi:hypothetical protein
MTLHAKRPPAGGADGPLECQLLAGAGVDVQANTPKPAPSQAEILRDPRAVREAKRMLRLEFLHEAAGGIQINAALVQTFAEIGDTAGVCYALKRLFAHAKAAHPVFVELREEAGQ